LLKPFLTNRIYDKHELVSVSPQGRMTPNQLLTLAARGIRLAKDNAFVRASAAEAAVRKRGHSPEDRETVPFYAEDRRTLPLHGMVGRDRLDILQAILERFDPFRLDSQSRCTLVRQERTRCGGLVRVDHSVSIPFRHLRLQRLRDLFIRRVIEYEFAAVSAARDRQLRDVHCDQLPFVQPLGLVRDVHEPDLLAAAFGTVPGKRSAGTPGGPLVPSGSGIMDTHNVDGWIAGIVVYENRLDIE